MRKILLVLVLFLFSTSVSWTENYCAGKQEKNIHDCKVRDYSEFPEGVYVGKSILQSNNNSNYCKGTLTKIIVTEKSIIINGNHISGIPIRVKFQKNSKNKTTIDMLGSTKIDFILSLSNNQIHIKPATTGQVCYARGVFTDPTLKMKELELVK